MASQSEEAARRANDLLVNRIDRWIERANRATQQSKTLVYERVGDGDNFLPLMVSPENHRSRAGAGTEAPFVVANSMREVQPEINILVSPLNDRLHVIPPAGAPSWSLPIAKEGEEG